MPATPAEVANDLAAQAKFFVKRDDKIANLCIGSARVIRARIAGEAVDKHVFQDVLVRLVQHVAAHGGMPERETQITKSLRRALETLQTLRAE